MHSLWQQLEQLTPGGYVPGGDVAAEPTAWAAIALAAAGTHHGASLNDAAGRAGEWLAGRQARDGAVSVISASEGPYWTTSLAILAWQRLDTKRYADNIAAGVSWLLCHHGKTSPPSPHIGHNTMLTGWSWAADTHSWLEPTAFATLALTATGYGDHPRTREAVALLHDRLLPGGGCNYGNTQVLGQTLVPHLQPSGVVLWALAGETVASPRIEAAIDYMEHAVQQPTGCASLAYAIIALTAWRHRPANAEALIAEACSGPSQEGVRTRWRCWRSLRWSIHLL